jgi:hypothetical protein
MMELDTVADWQRAGGAEMGWRLMMEDAPVTFAVCRHYPGWLKMFRLFLWSHGADQQVEFLEAVDELQQWEPHAAMTRNIYDQYLSDREEGHEQITVSGAVRLELENAFAAVSSPDRANVFNATYRESIVLVNESWYRQFRDIAEEIRSAPNPAKDRIAGVIDQVRADPAGATKRCRKALTPMLSVSL